MSVSLAKSVKLVSFLMHHRGYMPVNVSESTFQEYLSSNVWVQQIPPYKCYSDPSVAVYTMIGEFGDIVLFYVTLTV